MDNQTLKELLIITEDKKKQREIGKKILEEKKDVYTEKVIQDLLYQLKTAKGDYNFHFLDDLDILYLATYHYWLYGTGIKEYLCQDYYCMTHEEKMNYVTFRKRFFYCDYLNNKADVHMLANKYEAYERLKTYYKRDAVKVASESDFPAFEQFFKNHPVFVSKPVDLASAIGVTKHEYTNETDSKTVFANLLQSMSSFSEDYRWGGKSGMILEELIDEDERLKAFSKGKSVCVFRITTVRIDQQVHIFGAQMKTGIYGNFISAGATNGLVVGIDVDSGKMVTDGYNEGMLRMKKHPDSGITFAGFQVPCWGELIEMMTTVAKLFPTIRYVGWDVALSKKGWCIVEGNVNGEFIGVELMEHRGVKDDIEELIGWKPNKQFWWE